MKSSECLTISSGSEYEESGAPIVPVAPVQELASGPVLLRVLGLRRAQGRVAPMKWLFPFISMHTIDKSRPFLANVLPRGDPACLELVDVVAQGVDKIIHTLLQPILGLPKPNDTLNLDKSGLYRFHSR